MCAIEIVERDNLILLQVYVLRLQCPIVYFITVLSSTLVCYGNNKIIYGLININVIFLSETYRKLLR